MTDRIILNGALRVALFVFAAKLAVALREAVIAWRYGVGPTADAYNVATSIGTWLPTFLAGAIGAALVPALIRARAADPTEERRFLKELDGHAVALAAAVSLFGLALVVAAPAILPAQGETFERQLRQLLLAFAPFAGMTTIYYYLSNRLQAGGRFSYTLVESLPALAVALAIVALDDPSGTLALVMGTLVGGAMQIGVMGFLIRQAGVASHGAILTRRASQWSTLAAGIGIMALGQAALSLVLPMDQFFALQIGEGVPAIFGYANRVIGLGTSLGTIILGRALLPSLAAVSQEDRPAAARAAKRWTGYAFVLGAVALVAGWALAPLATRIIFERGSFTGADTAAVAQLIRLGLLQLPFFLSGVAAVQWLAVEGRYTLIATICIVTLATKFVLLLLLTDGLGASALMLSAVGMYSVAWLCQVVAIFQEPMHERGGASKA